MSRARASRARASARDAGSSRSAVAQGMNWLSIYRVVLLALPKDLRRKHGRSMERLFVRALGQARKGGRLHGVLAGVTGLWDVVARGLYERGRHGARGMRGSHRPGGWGMNPLLEDLRHTIRSLRRAPAFTVTCVLILALGIGTATAVFAAFRAVMLDGLPVADPDRIVSLTLHKRPSRVVYLNREEIEALRRESRTLQRSGDGALMAGRGPHRQAHPHGHARR
jgi:hypothetical protein